MGARKLGGSGKGGGKPPRGEDDPPPPGAGGAMAREPVKAMAGAPSAPAANAPQFRPAGSASSNLGRRMGATGGMSEAVARSSAALGKFKPPAGGGS